jgi:hypothetical protein
MITDVIKLIDKGIMQVSQEGGVSSVFEASLNISNIPKGTYTSDLKHFLINFKNEMYCEKTKTMGQVLLHFYDKQRAKDALSYIQNTPNQF